MFKKLFFVILGLLPLFAFANNGAFIILQPTNFYKTSKMEDRDFRTTVRGAYDVEQFKFDNNAKLVKLSLRVYSPTEKVSAEGFILKNIDPNAYADKKQIRVFNKIPANNKEKMDFILVDVEDITSRNTVAEKKSNSTLTWEKIEYRKSIYNTYWVYSNTGIFRPDLNATQLNALSKALQAKRYSTSRTILVLSGFLAAGSTQDWVSLALGEPINSRENKNGLTEWIYPNQTIFFKNKRVDSIVYIPEYSP